jgi:YHS domain-containing protein
MKKGLLLFCLLPLWSSSGINALGADGASQGSSYPLETCVVSGEKLGSMGKSFVHTYQGREVQFCCKACLKEFNKDPQKFLKKLDAASEKPKS